MTTFVDDEVAKLQAEKLAKLQRDAKKHKTPNTQKNGSKQQQNATVMNRPLPPVFVINSLLNEIYAASYPVMKEFRLDLLLPTPIPIQVPLDKVIASAKASVKEGEELTEEKLKNFTITLWDCFRELNFFDFIKIHPPKTGKVSETMVSISKKGVIYMNSINYLTGGHPLEHYATFNQIAVVT